MPAWYMDWLWSLPLLFVTVLFHVFFLLLIRNKVVHFLEHGARHRQLSLVFAMGITVLLITVLHAGEATAWGVVYLWLGALPDAKTAMLYSLSAMTASASIELDPHWKLMGAVESINGVVLFGFTTAVLFSIVEHISGITDRQRQGE